MTGDPERLLRPGSSADALERELLACLRAESAPPSAKRALWRGIAAGLALTAPASAAAAGGGMAGSKTGATWLVKWLLAGALGVSAASGVHWALRPRALPPTAARKAEPAQAAPVAQIAPEPEPVAVSVNPTPPPTLRKRAVASSLNAESELLRSARAQLRAGDLAGAERSLLSQRKRFPRGVLTQERDVLQIELLRARGEQASARELAGQFLRAHPESPHAAKLRLLLDAP